MLWTFCFVVSGVYDEVATPLLANITIEYLGDSVDQDSLTKRTFQNYFEGSEFAISGRLANLLAANLRIGITAISADGKVDIVEHVPITEVSRLFYAWYTTMQSPIA